MPIPRDPIVLLSYINTCLRDRYDDLESLCDDLNLNSDELVQSMASLNCFYDSTSNQFK